MKNKIRVVLDLEPYGGVYGPVVRFFLTGPNGSPAGTGPKAWPCPLRWLSMSRLPGWSNDIEIRLPHMMYKVRGNSLRFNLYLRQKRAYYRLTGGRTTRAWGSTAR